MSCSQEFTRWSIVASGEGGSRIASQYFNQIETPSIDERFLILNTNRSINLKLAPKIKQNVSQTDDGEIAEKYTLSFGDRQGAGNFFPNGKASAREDIDRIVDRVARFGTTDAVMYITTLGGGTGNGSIPYIIEELQSDLLSTKNQSVDSVEWIDTAIQATFAIWPYYYEQPQRHFNAVCGLSRLLQTSQGDQNADLVFLAANSHMSNGESENPSEYSETNHMVTDAIDMIIGSGHDTDAAFDISDYMTTSSETTARHSTPAVATGLNRENHALIDMVDMAANNSYVPTDIDSTSIAHLIVRAPERMIETNKISESELYSVLRDWTVSHDIDTMGQVNITSKPSGGTEVDVLVLLCGFDLEPLLDHSIEQFERMGQHLISRDGGRGEENFTQKEFDRITTNLSSYRRRNS